MLMKPEELQRKLASEVQTRTFALEIESRAEGDEDDRRVSVAFSSEEPVERHFGYEILSHVREDMDLTFLSSGRAPLLLDHNPAQQIGVVERVELDATARKSRAVVRFGRSELAEEIMRDVTDQIRANISVGYTITRMDKTDEQINGRDVYRVGWFPQEVSIVSIPADKSVGVGRAAEPEKTKMDTEQIKSTIEVREDHPIQVDVEKMKLIAESETEKRLAQRAKDNKEILALATRHNRRDLADEAIAVNLPLDQFRGQLLEQIESKPLESSGDPIDASPKEQRSYSLLRALNAASRGDWSGAGFEAEMSQEVSKRAGKQPQGFYVPSFAWGKRELTVGTNASGGFFAPSQQLANEWVEALRARMVLPGLGMRIMSGLGTKIQIPKLSAGAAAAFVAESGSVADQTQTTAQITMQARTLGARTDVSRVLLLESDPSIEGIVRDDLVAAVANEIEDVAIEGGGSNEPQGIIGTTDVGAVTLGSSTNGAAPTWAMITNLVKEVEADNASINAGTLGFLTNPKAKSKMANTPKQASGVEGNFILNDPWTNLYGYPLAITTNCPSDLTKGSASGVLSAVIMGDFSQLLLGMWGAGPDIIVDPYTNSASGTVRIVVLNEVDVAVRHGESFAVCNHVITT